MNSLGWACLAAACITGAGAAFVMSMPGVPGLVTTVLFAFTGALIGTAFSKLGRRPKL